MSKKTANKVPTYRKESICQDCDNLNQFAENGCLASKTDPNGDFPESNGFCSKRKLRNHNAESAICPYCGHKNEILEIYEETGDISEENCENCGISFKYSVETVIYYNVYSYPSNTIEE